MKSTVFCINIFDCISEDYIYSYSANKIFYIKYFAIIKIRSIFALLNERLKNTFVYLISSLSDRYTYKITTTV